MKSLILFILCLLICISCKQTTTLSEAEKANITAEIRKTLTAYYDDIKKAGLTAEFKYLDSSSNFFWVPPGYSSAISYDSVVAILKKNAPKYKSVNNTLSNLKIIPISSEIATYTANLNSVMTDTIEQVAIYRLIESGVIIKRKNGWKLLSGQTSMLLK
jgi:hypothetical protein